MSLRRHLHRAYLRARQSEVLRVLAALQESQWRSADEIRASQWEKLRALLAHATSKVPFYRKAFREADLDVRDLQTPDDLRSLPVLTKEMIREEGSDLLSEDAGSRGAIPNATGGSTGEPLVFYQDREYRIHRQAVMYRGFTWCGWRVGGPLAYLWGSDVDSHAHRGLGALRDALLGVTWIDAFRLEESALDAVLRRLGSSDPDIFIGYASSLRHLARHALSRGKGPRLRAIETSAELLTPDARREIEEAFQCKVLDRYGCREAGVVAHECGSGEGWHVNAETVHVETDPDGRLLVTPLMNYSMPLIRYRNEDLVDPAVGGCSCGRALPLIKRIVGRQTDIICSPSGRAIHGEFFTHLFYNTPGIREFQVVQKTKEDLVIRIAGDSRFTAEDRRRIESAIHDHGDSGFRLRWEEVEEVPRTASGKLRFTISELGDG